jgi:hypothetical protein
MFEDLQVTQRSTVYMVYSYGDREDLALSVMSVVSAEPSQRGFRQLTAVTLQYFLLVFL